MTIRRITLLLCDGFFMDDFFFFGLGIIFFIMVSGSVPFYMLLFDDFHHNTGIKGRAKQILAVAYLFGFGVYYDAWETFKDPEGHIDSFETVRIFEVTLESIPCGAIQLLAAMYSVEKVGEELSLLQKASLVASIVSIAYGCILYWDRKGRSIVLDNIEWQNDYYFQALLAAFVSFDFVFRVTSVSYFIITFPAFQRTILPLLLFAGAILSWILARSSDGKQAHIVNALVMSFVTVPSTLGLLIICLDKKGGFKFWAYEWWLRWLVSVGFCLSSFKVRYEPFWFALCVTTGFGNVLVAALSYCQVGDRFFNLGS